MDAIRKQASKLREQVAKQQQAILRQLGQISNEPLMTDESELECHQQLQKLYNSTKMAKHFQRHIVRGIEGFISVSSKQMEIVRKLAKDCCKYGTENQDSGFSLARSSVDLGNSYEIVENERETLLVILGHQISEPLRGQITGAPLEDARHLTHRYEKLRQEVENQAAEVLRRRSKLRDSSVSAESSMRLQNAETRLKELKSALMALGKEATAAMLSVEEQQQQITFQSLCTMVDAERAYHRHALVILEKLYAEMTVEKQPKESSSYPLSRDGYNQTADDNANSNGFDIKHASKKGTYFFAKQKNMRERVREKNSVRLRDPERGHFMYDQREPYNYYKGSTSFFFTNFPDSHGQEEMWKVFLRWGRVIDVFIPPKKDKFGKTFGFVRFLDVQQPKVLEDKLDSLWIGSYKLRVNIPAFARGDAQYKIHAIQTFNGAVNRGGTKAAGWSYANVMGGGGKQIPFRGNTVATTSQFNKRATNRTNRWSGLEFEVTEEEMAWLKDCYVGKLSDPEGIQTLKQRFELEELLSVSLIPMGGNLVLIKALQGEMLEEKVLQNDKLFSRRFLDVRPWDPEMVARERSVWVKISGVPAHCGNENFFNRMALLVGSFITIDDSTRAKVRLDYGRALVKTACPDPIDKIVEVKINDVMFSIRIREEVFCDNSSRFLTDWKYQNPDYLSSDDEDSMANSILAVPELNLNDGVGVEDVQRLLSEFSNTSFGRNSTFKDGGRGTRRKGAGSRGAEEYNQPAKTLPNVRMVRLSGEDYISNSLLVGHRAGVISDSLTQEMEDLGHGSKWPNLPRKKSVGCAGPQHESEMNNLGRGECSKGSGSVSQEEEGSIGPETGTLVTGLEEINLSIGSTGEFAGVKVGFVEEGIGTEVGSPDGFNREGNNLFVKPIDSVRKETEALTTCKVYCRRHKNIINIPSGIRNSETEGEKFVFDTNTNLETIRRVIAAGKKPMYQENNQRRQT